MAHNARNTKSRASGQPHPTSALLVDSEAFQEIGRIVAFCALQTEVEAMASVAMTELRWMINRGRPLRPFPSPSLQIAMLTHAQTVHDRPRPGPPRIARYLAQIRLGDGGEVRVLYVFNGLNERAAA